MFRPPPWPRRGLSRRAETLASIPGVGRATAAGLLAAMPELGGLDVKAAASLALLRWRASPGSGRASASSRAVARTLTFSPGGVLAALDIVDHLDQITRIAFVEAELNPALAPQLFEFQMPPGVDVVGDVPAVAD